VSILHHYLLIYLKLPPIVSNIVAGFVAIKSSCHNLKNTFDFKKQCPSLNMVLTADVRRISGVMAHFDCWSEWQVIVNAGGCP
jgi:hypothetical protein